jgi:Holliday junction DNA helicase RuvA
LMAQPRSEAGADAPPQAVDGNVLDDAYQALLSVGHSPHEARARLDKVLAGGTSFKTVEDILVAIYKQAT